MRIEWLFGQALDGGTSWRHFLRPPASARAGWTACGVAGLLARAGLLWGAPIVPGTRAERVAALRARLAAFETTGLRGPGRSFAESFRHDPFGVADHLLTLRDALRLAGWDGGPLEGSDRLADLAALERLDGPPVPPGLPDALHAVATAIERSAAAPVEIALTLAEPASHLPAAVRRLVEALRARGAQVTEPAADAPIAAASDLGRLQRALLGAPATPLAGDGTVVLLEAETSADAADRLAAWRRDHPAADETWVVAAEGGPLDAGRLRHGLPAIGADSTSRARPALQVLPLRLALAFAPRDPLLAAELLSLAEAPLPRRVRRALLGALGDAPGIGGPVWRAAVDACIAEAADPKALARAIDDWFGGETFDPAIGIPAPAAAALCDRVAAWAAAEGDPVRLPAHGIAAALAAMLRAQPPEARLTRVQLERLHDLVLGAGTARALTSAEAGRPAVTPSPAGVVGAPAEVVWWGFSGPAAGAPLPFTGVERAALAARGVALPVAGALRAAETWGWRRPALAARERLVLVRWRRAGRDPTEDHPFLDELEALLPGGLEPCRRTALGTPALEPLAPWPEVAPRPLWRLPPAHLVPAGDLSFSRIDRLFACPLRTVLADAARLRPGSRAVMPDLDRVVGNLAHRLLQTVVVERPDLDADAAATFAGALFDERLEGEAAPLLLPGHEVERARAREAITGAARALVSLLEAGGWRAAAAEAPCEGTFAGRRYKGDVDLVLEGPARGGLLDLKLGRADRRHEQLARGRALQLALYARALKPDTGPWPAAGFLAIDGGRLLTTDGDAFPGGTRVEGPSAPATLALAEQAWRWWTRVLAAGLVPARALDPEAWAPKCADAAGDEAPLDGPAAVEPPCKFCEFNTLCAATVEAAP